jgi:hypothetical protein
LGDVPAGAVTLAGVVAGVVAGVPLLGVVMSIPVCEERGRRCHGRQDPEHLATGE